MKMRVYIPRSGNILSGKISEDEYEEAERYTEFFTDNDDVRGKGFYELRMSNPSSREQEREVIARFTKNGITLGYYGHEGWHPCTSTHEKMVNGTKVVFDSMVSYYFLQSEEYQDEDYTLEPSKEKVLSQVLDIDESALRQVVRERRES